MKERSVFANLQIWNLQASLNWAFLLIGTLVRFSLSFWRSLSLSLSSCCCFFIKTTRHDTRHDMIHTHYIPRCAELVVNACEQARNCPDNNLKEDAIKEGATGTQWNNEGERERERGTLLLYYNDIITYIVRENATTQWQFARVHHNVTSYAIKQKRRSQPLLESLYENPI